MTKIKAELLDQLGVERALRRISHEIIETNKGVENIVLIGVAKGGIPICERLAKNIEEIEKTKINTGILDITSYRDDREAVDMQATLKFSKINFPLQGKDVVLCDDVLFTGRSIRAAIEAVFKLGRPKTIQLAVLIDRGHRELPFRADYVGKNVPTSIEESVRVIFDLNDGSKAVILEE